MSTFIYKKKKCNVNLSFIPKKSILLPSKKKSILLIIAENLYRKKVTTEKTEQFQ